MSSRGDPKALIPAGARLDHGEVSVCIAGVIRNSNVRPRGVYGSAKVKIELPAAIATTCLPLLE